MTGEKQQKLTEMVESFCDEYLNDEYKELCLELIEKMAERKTVPFMKGKLEVWAAATIYSVSQVNSLFDESNENHITRKDINGYFKTSQTKVSLKANNLRDIFNMDANFTLKDNRIDDETDEKEMYKNIMDQTFDGKYDMTNESFRTIKEYQRDIDRYRKELGEDLFREQEGHFWLIPETRPFMQALFEQSQLLWDIGEKERAINQYKYMLKLNPGDNQGARYSLLINLFELNRLDEAEDVYLEFDEESSANWEFSKLLLDIKKNVPFDELKIQYTKATESNPYVVPYLLVEKEIPDQLPYFYGFGDENEAIFCALLSFTAWHSDRKAIRTLEKLAK